MTWLRRPEVITDLVQILKSALAATGAWLLSVFVLESEFPFLAPWIALLTVHATVYRSVSHGIQATASSAVGVGLTFVIGHFLGVNGWTFFMAILAGLVVAQLKWIRDEGISIATTAIFVLGSGFSEQDHLLLERLFEVAVGVGVGIAVNMLVVPPLRERQAARYVDSISERLGTTLRDMADDVDTSHDTWDTDNADHWLSATYEMDQELTSAWQSIRIAQESRRGNPRVVTSRLRGFKGAGVRTVEAVAAARLSVLDEGVSVLRQLARTLRTATYEDGQWDEQFRQEWIALIDDVGQALIDHPKSTDHLEDRLTVLATALSQQEDLPQSAWPTYGALLTGVRQLVRLLAELIELSEPSRPDQPTDADHNDAAPTGPARP